MSRIGKLPIKVPLNVEVTIQHQMIDVSGPHGKLSRKISDLILISYTDNTLSLEKKIDSRISRQLHGLSRTLINNMIIGVSERFERCLELKGVGYRGQIKGKELILNLGYSHPIIMVIPEGIEVRVENNTTVILLGFDKELVGQFAATIRNKRPPEPYKGKGILYKGEIIKRKVGKSGK
uniref:Large ribosomal subunit protein uL6c n=1 Tax=Schizocladia ischiensis TaxID=196139 RepID=A0A7S6ZPC2_9STRA|nr:ribosomal protein L6 [Schizocladia ischiensis]QOW07548.1 ribosomal protein L6 [Schizocladia ischiensis]